MRCYEYVFHALVRSSTRSASTNFVYLTDHNIVTVRVLTKNRKINFKIILKSE